MAIRIAGVATDRPPFATTPDPEVLAALLVSYAARHAEHLDERGAAAAPGATATTASSRHDGRLPDSGRRLRRAGAGPLP